MKKLLLILIFLSFLISAWFYWFQYRPSRIRSECQISTGIFSSNLLKSNSNNGYVSTQTSAYLDNQGKLFYESCLHKNGL